jgi:DNA-directed RNA polymerase specialized sigma24 family protein
VLDLNAIDLRGSFRAWLFTVVRNRLLRLRAHQDRPGRGSGDSAAQELLQEVPAREQNQATSWDGLLQP